MKLSKISGGSELSLIEEQDGGVLLFGASTPEELFKVNFRLRHAQSEWEELPQRLQGVGRTRSATLIPDSYANCTITAK